MNKITPKSTRNFTTDDLNVVNIDIMQRSKSLKMGSISSLKLKGKRYSQRVSDQKINPNKWKRSAHSKLSIS